jgi:transglutaminase-like putative cysteine protease
MTGRKAVTAALFLLATTCFRASAQDVAPPPSSSSEPSTTLAPTGSAAPLAKVDALTRAITLSQDGSVTEVQHSELESSNPALIAQLAQFPIAYDEATQTVTITGAYTLKPDGRKETVGPNGIFDRSAPGNNITLSSVKQKVIIFPDVQPGDRMVYDATFVRKPLMPGQFTFDRVMPQTVVVDHENIDLSAPKSLPIYTDTPQLSVQKKDSGDTFTYSVSFSNPSAVPDDTNPIGRFDRSPRFSASTFKSYDDFAAAYSAMALPKIQVTADIQSRADSVVAGVTDQRERAKRLYDWVVGHVRYVAIELGVGGIVPHDAGSVLANGYGDCKDQAVLYAALLKAEKIDANLVLIHSGSIYTVAKVPTLGSFDHVIVYLPRLGLYADTTTAGIVPFGTLPEQEYGKPILVVTTQPGSLKRSPVPDSKDASFNYTLTAKFDEEGHDDSASTWTATGRFLEPLRAIGRALQLDTQGKIASDLFKARGTPRANGGFAVPADVTAESFQITANYKTPGSLVAFTQNRSFVIPDSLRITPLTSDLFFGPIFNDKFQKADAIPCSSGRGVDDETLEFTATRKLSSLPSDKKISTDHFTYSSHWAQDGNKVHVHRELEARFDQVVCPNPVKDEALTVLQSIRSDLVTQIALTQTDTHGAK